MAGNSWVVQESKETGAMRSRERLIEVLKTVNSHTVEWAPLLHRAAEHLENHFPAGIDMARLNFIADDPEESPHIRELSREAAHYLTQP